MNEVRTTHTPGPWYALPIQGAEADEVYPDQRGAAFIVGEDLGGLVGAALPWPTELESGDFSRVAANARLFAAAPALLAALKAVVGISDRQHEAWDAAKAAIASAESSS